MTPSRLLRAKKISPAKIARWLEGLGFEDGTNTARHVLSILSEKTRARVFLGIADRFFELAASSPDPDRALLNLERFFSARTPERDSFESPAALELLVRAFSVSLAFSDALVRSPELFDWLLAQGTLDRPKDKATLALELAAFACPGKAAVLDAQFLSQVRRFKSRELLRIGVRDLMSRASLEETTLEVSHLADVCVAQIYELAFRDLATRYGLPFHEAESDRALRADFAVIGMGKLGGQELNYSSDIDLMFLYSAEGETATVGAAAKRRRLGCPSLANHQFHTKRAEAITDAVGRVTEDGNVFRIDLRLRPEGASGPIVRSLESYENYYAQWGQTWERMALIKARCIAGSQHLADEFFEVVQSFRYPRHISERILREVAQIKVRLENEIVKEERLSRHVKLGVGGIREIEFVVQTLQLLHGGKQPFIQTPNTLTALQKLSLYEILPQKDCDVLREAYRFLRTVEHRLQMESELQTHTVPPDAKARLLLAAAGAFP